jgi:hypothetical protein
MTEEMEQAFEAMEWHDSVLLSLNIDRRTPGKRDEVVLVVEWLDGRKQKVSFTDCYALDAQMNFGVIAPESIRAARCIAASPKLAEMRQRWAALGVDLESLRCFEITTNSTASEICIYAKRYEVSDS